MLLLLQSIQGDLPATECTAAASCSNMAIHPRAKMSVLLNGVKFPCFYLPVSPLQLEYCPPEYIPNLSAPALRLVETSSPNVKQHFYTKTLAKRQAKIKFPNLCLAHESSLLCCISCLILFNILPKFCINYTMFVGMGNGNYPCHCEQGSALLHSLCQLLFGQHSHP